MMKIKNKGLILLIVITVVYSIISFYNLGTLVNPQTFIKFEKANDYAIFELNDNSLSKIRYYTGVNTGKYNIYISDDLKDYTYITTTSDFYVFSWNDVSLSGKGKYLYIQTVSPGTYLGEIVAYDTENNKINLLPVSENANYLVDEQDTVPEEISYLNSTYFDEVYHARAAFEYIHNLKPYEWVHPPLGKLLISLPVRYLGMTTFAYRLMGNIAGIIMIPVMYMIAKKLFKSEKCGVIAALIMACDGMHFAQTRIATVDSYLTLFIMISYLFMIRYLELKKEDSVKKKIKELFFCGLFIGFAIDTKWSAMFAAMGLAIIFFVHLIYNCIKDKKWTMDNTKIILSCIVSFVIVPIIIYVASYAPFFSCPESEVKDFQSFIEHQKGIYEYHSKLEATHPFTSPWYTWPILYKPVWYYVGYFANNQVSTIACLGNPIIWWGGILGVIYLAICFIKHIIKKDFEKIKAPGILLTVIATTFLSYIFVGRIMFLYHYFITLPFVMLALAGLINFIDDFARKHKFKFVIPIFSIIIITFFIYFFPVVSGYRVSKEYIDNTKWLKTWIY